MFSMWSVPRCYKQGTRLELGQLVCEENTNWSKNTMFGREPLFREDVNTEAEESPV
jgi:hypothetical protein